MTLKAWVGMWALGLAALFAATSAAAACDWHKSMTMASAQQTPPAVTRKVASTPAPKMSPVVHKKVVISTYPVDLWLLPYLS